MLLQTLTKPWYRQAVLERSKPILPRKRKEATTIMEARKTLWRPCATMVTNKLNLVFSEGNQPLRKAQKRLAEEHGAAILMKETKLKTGMVSYAPVEYAHYDWGQKLTAAEQAFVEGVMREEVNRAGFDMVNVEPYMVAIVEGSHAAPG